MVPYVINLAISLSSSKFWSKISISEMSEDFQVTRQFEVPLFLFLFLFLTRTNYLRTFRLKSPKKIWNKIRTNENKLHSNFL